MYRCHRRYTSPDSNTQFLFPIRLVLQPRSTKRIGTPRPEKRMNYLLHPNCNATEVALLLDEDKNLCEIARELEASRYAVRRVVLAIQKARAEGAFPLAASERWNSDVANTSVFVLRTASSPQWTAVLLVCWNKTSRCSNGSNWALSFPRSCIGTISRTSRTSSWRQKMQPSSVKLRSTSSLMRKCERRSKRRLRGVNKDERMTKLAMAASRGPICLFLRMPSGNARHCKALWRHAR